ncbi:diacylglycerol/lipid kinase family protein [Limosilactobacillus fastidiosus]|uniref:YegS/Rv2252/BmrU family lipid kinase n=1 Tax=Limosilactobacillus fastidiosus TaxID=2759855 RepID=A0A7W3TXR9_9LACO|nr:YegS/Rv2252/BmrU family lipid kinase [Limosilactobacillus fastidiosus]MBB1062338.1 YegS/Rv2252/BmrU family lipid kinase [Limosilactobacillus fastidiosus]MBB1085249.1 YegS/Rv2252/BmrU family lipid kinase [Limosilactobacillus fastidiosus]MCD7083414.1 YegS/Rv2252/BmrU family lipid kinase [Limosilactobacillus fastidiosus]MCD7085234.1 YegS/Rv2252/BmrU family lipid kinase [Limosilactobacillus fastidiosus]MCD7115177.1 YegS/Rv2252/BmrU family lipid kinase [Limosilactobacillus fastidiosus]
MHYEIILNPTAGNGKAQKTWNILRPSIEGQLDYSLHQTSYSKHEVFLAKKISTNSNKNTVVIVIGGDGTLHNVLNGLINAGASFPLSYIPAGTGNDFARGYGISLNPEKALQQILSTTEARTITIGHYFESIKKEEGFFLNNIGIGFDAAIVSRTNSSSTKKRLNRIRLGSLSYLSKAFGVIYDQQPFQLTLQEQNHHYIFPKAFIVVATNHPYLGGGFQIDHSAKIEEDAINMVIAERKNWLLTLWEVIQLARGKLAESRFAQRFHANKLHYSTTSLEFGQIDGENMGNRFYDLTINTSHYRFWQDPLK